MADALFKTVLVGDQCLHPEADTSRRYKSTDQNTDQTILDDQNNRNHKVYDHFKDRLVTIVPIQSHRITEIQCHLAHTAHIKVQYNQKHNTHREKIIFARPDLDKRIEHDKKGHCRIGMDPKADKIQGLIDMKNAFFVIRDAKVSDTCDKGTQNAIDGCIDTSQKHTVIVKNTHGHQTDKGRNDQTVRIVDHDITQLVHEHGTDILKDALLCFLGWQRLAILFQIRIHPVAFPGD